MCVCVYEGGEADTMSAVLCVENGYFWQGMGMARCEVEGESVGSRRRAVGKNRGRGGRRSSHIQPALSKGAQTPLFPGPPRLAAGPTRRASAFYCVGATRSSTSVA